MKRNNSLISTRNSTNFVTKTINPWVRDDDQPKNTVPYPVESGRSGGPGPAEAKPRDCNSVRCSNKQNTILPPTSNSMDWCPCGVCGITTDIPEVDWIFCDSCSTWFHGTCLGLNNEDLKNLAEPSIKWNCLNCSNETQPNPSQPSYIICQRCLDNGSTKKFKGTKGLKQHYNYAHKQFLAELLDKDKSGQTIDFQIKLAEFKQTIRVLKRIPKGARIFAAVKLEELITNAIESNDLNSWYDLLSFAYVALRTPQRSSKKLKLTNIVKNNIIRFDKSNLEPTIKPDKSSSLNRRVESKICDGDVRGAVKLLASSDQLAPQTSDVLQQLKDKHPCPSRPLQLPEQPKDSENHLVTNELDVAQAIQSFPNGSASGIDGICPQILKDLTCNVTGEVGRRLLTAITRLCNFMLKGSVHDSTTPILYGASLCALKKKDGGLRPIAVGNTFRRLTAKLACKSIREPVGNYFRPQQLGFATRGGCEAAKHAVRTFLEKNSGSSKVLLKIDFKNAFNTIERDIMLSVIKEKTPELYPFLWQCYANNTYLFFGKEIINSQVEGDPAGPMAFGLTIQPIIQSLISELNIWYLDDGTLAGNPETVLADFKTLIEECSKVGLTVNPTKCEVHFCSTPNESIQSQFNELSPGITTVDNEDLCLLGSPLKEPASQCILKKKLEELRTLLSRLSELNNHISYFLLKNCLAIPKLTYLLHTCPTWKFPEIIAQFDDSIRQTLQEIINSNLQDDKWMISSLPIRYGGIGIRRVEDIGVPAFLASINGVFDLVCDMLPTQKIADIFDISCYADAIEAWSSLCPNSPIPTIPSVQQNWDKLHVENLIESIPLLSDTDKARYLASCTKESNAWLNALPSKNVGLLLTNNDFRISIVLRLGLDICTPHTCKCGQVVNCSGIHGLCCMRSSGRFPRHVLLNDILKRAFMAAEISVVLDPCGLSREDGKRPDGMTLVPWTSGKTLVWDATCTNTLAPSHIKSSSNSVGSAAEAAAKLKRNKYRTIIEQNYFFVPFAVETLGPWCEDAKIIVESLSRSITKITGEPKAKVYLLQRISIAIQRGNAACIMGTLPPTISMEEVFFLL